MNGKQKNHKCPFDNGQLYNQDLNGGNGFTLKEVIIDIQRKLDRNLKDMDDRVKRLENWRAGIVAVGGALVIGIPIAVRLIWG